MKLKFNIKINWFLLQKKRRKGRKRRKGGKRKLFKSMKFERENYNKYLQLQKKNKQTMLVDNSKEEYEEEYEEVPLFNDFTEEDTYDDDNYENLLSFDPSRGFIKTA